jgi:hypothetical protein
MVQSFTDDCCLPWTHVTCQGRRSQGAGQYRADRDKQPRFKMPGSFCGKKESKCWKDDLKQCAESDEEMGGEAAGLSGSSPGRKPAQRSRVGREAGTEPGDGIQPQPSE